MSNFGNYIMIDKTDFLLSLVRRFRNAIVLACSCGEFSTRDRMIRFPNGCCDDASDLLAYYLYNVHSIRTEQFNGVYYDNKEPENITNHSWLKYEDYIIDITYSQFSFVTNSKEEIYFGETNEFFNSLDRIQHVDHYNIESDCRLWKDYKSIIKHLQSK